MDTLHAPGARTPFGHGAGARVWQGRRRGREREEKGDAFSSEGDAVSALMIKFRIFVATTSSPLRRPIADFSCVGRGSGIVKVLRKYLSSQLSQR